MIINETYLKKAISQTVTHEVESLPDFPETLDEYMHVDDSNYPFVYRLTFDYNCGEFGMMLQKDIPEKLTSAVYEFFDSHPQISDFVEVFPFIVSDSFGGFDSEFRTQNYDPNRPFSRIQHHSNTTHAGVFTDMRDVSEDVRLRSCYLYIRFDAKMTGKLFVSILKGMFKLVRRIMPTVPGVYQFIHKHIELPYTTHCKLPEFHDSFINIANTVQMANECGADNVFPILLNLGQNLQYCQKEEILRHFVYKAYREFLVDGYNFCGRYKSSELNLQELMKLFPNRAVFPFIENGNKVNEYGETNVSLDVNKQILENPYEQDVQIWIAEDPRTYKKTLFLWIGGTVEYAENKHGIAIYTTEDYNTGQASFSTDYSDILTAYCLMKTWKSFNKLQAVEKQTKKHDMKLLNGLDDHQKEVLKTEVNEKLSRIWKKRK